MYLPKHFREDDLTRLQDFMRQNPFAIVITTQNGIPIASHIPLILDPQHGTYGTLVGHFALGNEQWRTFDGSQEVLVIFQGPHAYISPSWYEEPATTVPTWNYTTVHAYGTPRIINDLTELVSALAEQVQTYEAAFEQPWGLDQSDAAVQKKARGIVGFALPIARIEGKFKLNQNRSRADQQRVVAKLEDMQERGVAALMQNNLAHHSE